MALGRASTKLSTMSESHAANGRKAREFSLPIFTLTVLSALLGLIVILGLVAPQAVWRVQVSAKFWQYLVALLVIKLVNCFVEYFFHRSMVRGDRRFDELKQGDVVQVIPGPVDPKGPRAESIIA